jgi:hypothetical protein
LELDESKLGTVRAAPSPSVPFRGYILDPNQPRFTMTNSKSLLITTFLCQIFLVQTIANNVQAQEKLNQPATNKKTSKNAFSDIVVLKTGRTVLGMLVHSDFSDKIEIVDGENQKQTFPTKEVQFAGSYAKWIGSQPTADQNLYGPVPPARKPLNPPVRVEFRGLDERGPLTFFQHPKPSIAQGSAGAAQSHQQLSPVCQSPCAKTLPPGKRQLSLGPNAANAIQGNTIHIQEPSTVTGVYTSHAATRTAGWVIAGTTLGLGILGATASATLMQESSCPVYMQPGTCSPRINGTLFFTSVGVALTGALLGGWMTQISDTVKFEVAPLQTPAKHLSGKQSPSKQASSVLPKGVMVRGTFLNFLFPEQHYSQPKESSRYAVVLSCCS